MTKFIVTRKVDAYVLYETEVEADDPLQARDIADRWDYEGEWRYAGEVQEFDHAEIHLEDVREADEDDTVDPAHLEYVRLDVTRAERDTMLAALRHWQVYLNTVPSPEMGVYGEIATNGGEHGLMPEEEIDGLCERINI